MPAYQKDLVSVIMPAFNSERYIAEAVESVLQQSYKNFELIIVNDGSTDRTDEILQKYSNGIHYIKQPNLGVSAARNKGILASHGEYVSFLDSDDLWFKETIKLQHTFLTSHPEVGLVYGEMQLFDHTGPLSNDWVTSERVPRPEGYIFKDLILSCLFGLSTVMVRKDVLNNVGVFDPNLPAGEDYELWLRISSKYKIGYIPDRLMMYRRHPASLTTSAPPLKPWDILVAEKTLKTHPDESKQINPFLLQRKFAARYFQAGYSAFKEGHYPVARYRLAKSFQLAPNRILPLLYLIASSIFPRFNQSAIRAIRSFLHKTKNKISKRE